MDYSKLAAVTGKPGLFEVVGQRNNGLIVKSLVNGKTHFVSVRTHAFSMLNNISIYTYTDSENIEDILKTMLRLDQAGSAPVEVKASKEDIRAYFKEVMPDHDEEKVYVSDIKKLIKWYHLLKEKDMISLEDTTEENPAEATTETSKEEEE